MANTLMVGSLALLALSGVACSSTSGGTPLGANGGAAGNTPSSGAGADNGGALPDSGGASSGGNNGGAAPGGAGTANAGAAGSAGSAGQAPTGPLGPAPDFGPNVLIFDPAKDMAAQQALIKPISDSQNPRGTGQFSSNRYALLFKPGSYQLDVQVGYYEQILGLGQVPDDVQINGGLRAHSEGGNATLNFWREVENISSVSTQDMNSNVWAVSQGTALRRVHMKGALNLSDGGNSSGGFIADLQLDGSVVSGSQQQFFSRNSSWTAWTGGVWNMAFSGVDKPPQGVWPASPYTVIAKTPLVREKPYLSIDAGGHYFVNVPAAKTDSVGTSFAAAGAAVTAISTDKFYIAKPADTSATINAALTAGKHLLLTPGIYHLEASLQITNPGTVVFGLGMATLVPSKGTPALSIADVDGVEVAGVIVDAGPMNSTTLVEVGPAGSKAVHSANPSALHDLFCRVGGGSAGTANSCVTINSSDVIGDNLWMWRADHGAGVGWTSNASKNGLIVNGDNVTMYGLFVEHFQEYQVLWNGNGGRTEFYQSELPYDPPDQPSWTHDGVNGYAAYKVAPTVTSHEAQGLGIYSAFHSAVATENAIETPAGPGIVMHHLMTYWLNGNAGSAITHIVNGTGASAVPASHLATSAD